MLELLALGTDHEAAIQVATDLGGIAYVNHPDERDTRPYSSVVRVSTDDVEAVSAVADVALHVAYARQVKAPSGPASRSRVVASFPLVHHPALTHRQADDHWRDTHGPLALEHHAAMCDYTQLSVVATISGQPIDGLAMCAFDSREEMRHKFFNNDESRAAIQADVAKFADMERSPRRVVLTQVI